MVPAIRLKANADLSQVDMIGLQGRLSSRGGPESVERHPNVGVASLGWEPEHIGCAGACAVHMSWVNRGAGLYIQYTPVRHSSSVTGCTIRLCYSCAQAGGVVCI